VEGEAEEREEEDGMDMRVEAGGRRGEKVDGLRGGDDFSGFLRTGRMARAGGGGRWGGRHGGNIIVVVGEEGDMQAGTPYLLLLSRHRTGDVCANPVADKNIFCSSHLISVYERFIPSEACD
jgi:hypothetical protein